jgi:branched-chain amino acid transport system permease protein
VVLGKDSARAEPGARNRATAAEATAKRGVMSTLGAPSSERKLQVVGGLAVLAVLVLAPGAVPAFRLSQLEVVFAYGIAAIGLNITVGYAGEFVVAQPAVMAAAGYSAGLMSTRLGWSSLETLVPAVCIGAICGTIISLPGLRISGFYLAIVSFFAVLIIPNVTGIFENTTGGAFGLLGVPPLVSSTNSSSNTITYEVGLLALALIYIAQRNFRRSAWGLRVLTLRDAPIVLSSSGVGVASTKLATYALASIPAAIAGWYLIYIDQSVSPDLFGLQLALALFGGVVVGGLGTLTGPLVGTALLQGYSIGVESISYASVIGSGLILVVALVLRPKGVVLSLQQFWNFVFRSADSTTNLPQAMKMDGREPDFADSGPAVAGSMSDGFLGASEEPEAEGDRQIPLLEVSHVSKSFGGRRVLTNASLTVMPHHITGLIGENGSGKTTLLNLVSGVDRPDSGDILIGETSIVRKPIREITRLGIARTFQLPMLVGDVSVRENVELGLLAGYSPGLPRSVVGQWCNRRTTRARRQRAEEALAGLGLTGYANVQAASLSLGLRRIVEIARVVAMGGRVLCLDEPASGLSDEESAMVGEFLRDLLRHGHGILLIEHNLDFIADICDQVAVLEGGVITARAGRAGQGGAVG